jgi:hypothetical protein
MSAAGNNPEGQRIGGGRFYLREELAAWCRAGCPERTFWREQWTAIQRRRNGDR